MKEYVKKFDTLASANNYAISDIPFTSTAVVSGETVVNVVCNEENKKLQVSGNTINVVNGEKPYSSVSFKLKGTGNVEFTVQNSGYYNFEKRGDVQSLLVTNLNGYDGTTVTIEYNGQSKTWTLSGQSDNIQYVYDDDAYYTVTFPATDKFKETVIEFSTYCE